MKTLGKKAVHLLSRNILSTAAVVAIMGAAAFAAAPTGGYAPGETLNPDCAPGDTDCTVQAVAVESDPLRKFVDGTTATDAVFTDGNVGIGMSDPFGTFHISSPSQSALKTYSGYGDSDGLVIDSYLVSPSVSGFGAFPRFVDFVAISDDLVPNRMSSFRFMAQGRNEALATEKMVITGDGNVGIGTTSPTEKLEVAGNIKASGDIESEGIVKATGGFILETRTSDPTTPVEGQMWLRTDI